MQRFCEGCRRLHKLEAFDLDSDEANSVCRAHARRQERAARAGTRRRSQSKIEALEHQRRGLIAALVQIDQEIAKERSLQVSTTLEQRRPGLTAGGEVEDVFGTEGEHGD